MDAWGESAGAKGKVSYDQWRVCYYSVNYIKYQAYGTHKRRLIEPVSIIFSWKDYSQVTKFLL